MFYSTLIRCKSEELASLPCWLNSFLWLRQNLFDLLSLTSYVSRKLYRFLPSWSGFSKESDTSTFLGSGTLTASGGLRSTANCGVKLVVLEATVCKEMEVSPPKDDKFERLSKRS